MSITSNSLTLPCQLQPLPLFRQVVINSKFLSRQMRQEKPARKKQTDIINNRRKVSGRARWENIWLKVMPYYTVVHHHQAQPYIFMLNITNRCYVHIK